MPATGICRVSARTRSGELLSISALDRSTLAVQLHWCRLESPSMVILLCGESVKGAAMRRAARVIMV